ncbi:MAG: zinc-ribbon domain-containing protein [Blautia sp.]|nr:zinc-ribbon domain-containing protein [Blautia sp.]
MKDNRPLSETNPELVPEWSEKNFPFLPEDETRDSYSKVWWKCKRCGTQWQAPICNRAKKETGCPCCAGKLVKKGYNDFASKRPELVKEWSERNYPLMPDQVVVHSSQSVWWVCAKGHEWKTTVGNRFQGNTCPICAREELIPGVNDLATTHPSIAAEWSERNVLSPKDIRASYRKQVWWICPKCGNEYKAQTMTRVYNPTRPCPYCRGKLKEDKPPGPSPPESNFGKDGDGR